jgi:hypothetical protein
VSGDVGVGDTDRDWISMGIGHGSLIGVLECV